MRRGGMDGYSIRSGYGEANFPLRSCNGGDPNPLTEAPFDPILLDNDPDYTEREFDDGQIKRRFEKEWPELFELLEGKEKMDDFIEIAEAINKEISEIFQVAVNRRTADYPCIRWEILEEKIHKAVYRHMGVDE